MNDLQKRRIRRAISVYYLAMGMVFASWASRIPDVKAALSLDDGSLGALLFAIPAGQIAMMAISAMVIAHWGSRMVLRVSLVAYAAVLFAISQAPTFVSLFVVLFLFGMAANILNISVNTQSVELEKLYGRSILSTFHGLWSLGGLLGGLVGTGFVLTGLPLWVHYAVVSILCVGVTLPMGLRLMDDSKLQHSAEKAEDDGGLHGFGRLDGVIIMLGFVAFGGMFCEGTVYDWSSVYMATVVCPPEALVRAGYIAGMAAMTFGRFVADRFITRYDAAHVLRISGASIVAGLLIATAFPYLVTATLGFLLVGLGMSTVVPICYSAAGRHPRLSPATAITVVSSISFIGFMVGPPLIGLLAQALTLRVALAVAASFGLLIIVFAPAAVRYRRQG